MAQRQAANPVPREKEEKTRAEEQEPRHAPRYRVLVHNDDVTPMDYVIEILRTVFYRQPVAAARIMLEAHKRQLALVDLLPLEQAEFRVDRAHSLARAQKFPLTFTYEPEA